MPKNRAPSSVRISTDTLFWRTGWKEMMIFDFKEAYIGSANLTGAGIGMKSVRMRNFEGGILTDDLSLVDAAAEHFDSVWRGEKCKDCGRRQFCGDPII